MPTRSPETFVRSSIDPARRRAGRLAANNGDRILTRVVTAVTDPAVADGAAVLGRGAEGRTGCRQEHQRHSQDRESFHESNLPGQEPSGVNNSTSRSRIACPVSAGSPPKWSVCASPPRQSHRLAGSARAFPRAMLWRNVKARPSSRDARRCRPKPRVAPGHSWIAGPRPPAPGLCK